MGRNASECGIKLKDEKDEVIGMISVNDMDSDILVVSKMDMERDQVLILPYN